MFSTLAIAIPFAPLRLIDRLEPPLLSLLSHYARSLYDLFVFYRLPPAFGSCLTVQSQLDNVIRIGAWTTWQWWRCLTVTAKGAKGMPLASCPILLALKQFVEHIKFPGLLSRTGPGGQGTSPWSVGTIKPRFPRFFYSLLFSPRYFAPPLMHDDEPESSG